MASAALAAGASAQIGGGAVYNGQAANPAEVLRQQRALADSEIPPTLNSVFLDASVLMNVRADTYVAVFGISEEGTDLSEARAKVHAKIAALKKGLKGLNLNESDVSTDFVAQNRIYGFQIDGSTATEKVVGFELKENVSVRCRSQAQVDLLVAKAAKDGVFDLIKVDYVVSDLAAARAKLFAEASKVIAQKRADYGRLLGMKVQPAPQLYADRFNVFYPTDLYTSYQASEAENVDLGYNRQNFVVHGARKLRTFYYNPLTAKGFDRVINPIVTVPVVQCTLYLKLRYEAGRDRRLTTAKPRL